MRIKKDLPLNFEEESLAQYLSMSYAPEPDLFIRTGGELRISSVKALRVSGALMVTMATAPSISTVIDMNAPVSFDGIYSIL